MKKLVVLIIVLLCSVIVSSCCTEDNMVRTMKSHPVAYHFTYDGHDYIEFGVNSGGVVHNPKCPCMIEYE